MASDSANQEMANDPCGVCKEPVRSGQNGMQCESCGNWEHGECVGLTPELYKLIHMLGTHSNWFCTVCKPLIAKAIKKVTDLQKEVRVQ